MNVRTIADIEYTDNLSLDIHRPDSDAEVPCVMYFHGGGWARGTRKDFAEQRLLPVAASGLAVASVTYRLTDVATHPAQLEDARAAARWLRANASEHRLQATRLGAWGASAGGWIALMLLLTGDERVDAAAAWFAPTNLATVAAEREAAALPLPPFMQGRQPPDMEAGLLGLGSVSDDLAAASAASPVTHAASASGPALLIHGDRDGMVNSAQSLALHSALADSQLLVIAGANHEDPAFHKPAVLAATAGFFSAL